MMRSLIMTVISLLMAGAVGVGLFFVKHEVKEQEARLSELNMDIQRNQEAIHVLKAEWSYLNDPARLRALSEKHLSMKVVSPGQVATLNSLPGGNALAAKDAKATPKVAAGPISAPAPPPAKPGAPRAPQGQGQTPAVAQTQTLPGDVR